MYDHNKIELRIDVKNADGRSLAFEDAKSALKNYLAVQGVHNVSITLSDNLPQQNENSGKFKHIVNMQNI